jgi:prepilin-type N-terminal cleavage/methylation domain-containing protein
MMTMRVWKTDDWGESGFSLVELIVAVGVIAILLALATLNFSKMTKKSQIEKETRQLFTDVNNARTQAMFSKKPSSIWFQPQSYNFVTYSSASEDPTVSTNGKTVSTTSVTYLLTAANGTSIANTPVLFDVTGLTANYATGLPANSLTIMVNPSGSGAAFDCVIIDVARTNMGNMQNGACILK